MRSRWRSGSGGGGGGGTLPAAAAGWFGLAAKTMRTGQVVQKRAHGLEPVKGHSLTSDHPRESIGLTGASIQLAKGTASSHGRTEPQTGKAERSAMANKATATTSWRWRLLLLLLLAVAALCWIPPAIAMAAAASTASGTRRSLLGFVEAHGNSSYRCTPSGPCIPCQYSEKNDEKYSCSETGYRLPLKCQEVQNGAKEGNNSTQRKVLDDASTSGGTKHYVTYRSCVPLEDEEKLSVLGFEVIMAGMLLISGPFVYFRKRRTNPMQGATRIPTSPPRF